MCALKQENQTSGISYNEGVDQPVRPQSDQGVF